MKKSYRFAMGFLLIAFTLPFAGCLKDTVSRTYTYTIYKYQNKTLAQVQAEVKNMDSVAITAPGKMYIIGNMIFLAEKGKGVHIIDNANPSAPVNKTFIPIPGNVDIAVYGHTLYADCYSVLFAIDITNPMQVLLTKTIALPVYNNTPYVDSTHFIFKSVEKKDTTVTDRNFMDKSQNYGGVYYSYASADASGSSTAAGSSGAASGQGGSMAGFAISGSYLYTVSATRMNVVSLAQAPQPELKNTMSISGGLETIYPFQDKLFVGSSTGMLMYSVANPLQPALLGTFTHARVCDPVIADSQYAYVTLRSGTQCSGFTNQLDVVNVQNLSQPTLVRSYSLTNPRGLSKDGRWLFICDGKDGLKCFDAAIANAVTLKTTIPMAETYDVICYNNTAIVSAVDGLYQYDYSNINNIKLLSRMGLVK